MPNIQARHNFIRRVQHSVVAVLGEAVGIRMGAHAVRHALVSLLTLVRRLSECLPRLQTSPNILALYSLLMVQFFKRQSFGQHPDTGYRYG